ncbi:MAG: four helix bundle protein [Chlorobiota bacterium]|nr:MAG: four helix bundle protein [Chlorobiota bacterium]
MNRDELKKRTKEFALRIIKLVNALPNNSAGRVIGNQLLRSGTSLGANYRAACRAKSKNCSTTKMAIPPWSCKVKITCSISSIIEG